MPIVPKGPPWIIPAKYRIKSNFKLAAVVYREIRNMHAFGVLFHHTPPQTYSIIHQAKAK
jgi:hypothetical protein